MSHPHRRFLSPPKDLHRLVVVLAATCGVCLIFMTVTVTWGYFYLNRQFTSIQEQRLEGARAQCRLFADEDGLDRCIARICDIQNDLGHDCDQRHEEKLAREP